MSLYSRYHTVSDQRWLEILTGTRRPGNALSRLVRRWFGLDRPDPALPKLPDAQLQKTFVGSSGAHALSEGFLFYQVIKQHCRDLGRPISPDSRLLDFGCGWGRVSRFFLKDVPSENFVGVDVDPEVIQICRETVGEGRYETVTPLPPSPLPDRSFDVIFAYSVFSHLAEDAHLLWVEEFSRLLKDGGLVFATTQKRSFIEYCNNLTQDQITTLWHQALATAFRPLDVALARYDSGELVYAPTGGGSVRDASFYGEAAFSERYANRKWPPHLKVLSFDEQTLAQALVIAQKPMK